MSGPMQAKARDCVIQNIMTLDRLTPNEIAVIKSIRQWREFPGPIPCPILPHPAVEQIAGFVAYLWRVDPYVVDVGSTLDNDLRLFEVQLLYVISEQLAGNSITTSEVLSWWFSNDEQSYARSCLNSICVNMQLSGVAVTAASWVREYFQSMTLKRVRLDSWDEAGRFDNDWAEPSTTAIH
jgi:hypothetical protein